MSPKFVARDADKGLGVNRYQRQQPEQTLLYQIDSVIVLLLSIQFVMILYSRTSLIVIH